MLLDLLSFICFGGVLVSSLYTSSDDVIELNPNNFNSEVIQSGDLWLVEFYAPWCGHCQSLAPEWKKAATALKGVVKVGAVDMDQHQSLGGPYNVRGFPTIKIFAADKNSALDYNGARSANSIVDTAMQHLRDLVNQRLQGRAGGGGGRQSGGGGGGSGGGSGDPKDVIELTDANFDQMVLQSEDHWLVEFFAPWCGHCKNLAPHWAKAASELKGKFKVAAVDATVHTIVAGRYGIQGFPTIKYFPSGKKDHFTPTDAQDYDGGRTGDDIVKWALEKVVENIPPPEATQITSDETMKSSCEGHQLCVISFLPHILDCQSDCRKSYLATLKEVGARFKKNQWGWIWSEAGAQPQLEQALGIGGFGYPAMATVNSRKMKYALLRGSFGTDGIHDFLRELSFGRGATFPVKDGKMPEISAIEAWDGKDGELPQEEEIDLSDVDLDDLPPPKKEEL